MKNLNPILGGKRIILYLFLILNFSAGINAQQTELSFQTGHVAAINKIVFSPDGNFLASADKQHKICIWDMTCLTQMTSFFYSGLAESDLISSLAFSRDNRILVVETAAGNRLVWDIGKSEKIIDLSSEKNMIPGQQPDSVWTELVKSLPQFLSSSEIKVSGGKAYAVASGFMLRFYSLPDQKKAFSASMPYIDELITDLEFLPRENYFLASTTDGKIYVYNYAEKKLIKVLKDHISEVNSLAVHPTKDIFASGSSDRSIILWDAQTFLPIKRFYSRASSIQTLELNESTQVLAFGNELGYTKVIKLTDKYPEIKSVKNHTQKVTDILFTNEGKSLITSSNDNHISKLSSNNLNIEEYKKVRKNFGFSYLLSNIIEKFHLYIEPFIFVDSISVSSDQNYFIADGYKVTKKAKRTKVDADGLPTKKRSKRVFSNIEKFEYSYSTTDLKKVKIKNPQKPVRTAEFRADSIIMGVNVINKNNGHISGITGAVFDKFNNRLITSSMDATIKIWDLTTKQLVITIIPIDKNKRIFITADNYYFAPKNSLDAIGFKQGINFYPLEQFDLEYNRPDIVLEQLKNPDTLLIKMYRNAYEKRMKKSGFSANMFTSEWHTPEMEILNADEFGYTIDQSQMQLKICGTDSKYNLDRFNVWINDVPLYGTNGMSLRSELSDSVVKTLSIPLSAGNNRIQVSCMNDKGVESLKRSVDISYNAQTPVKPDLYVIAMSVSEYQDPRYNLQYAVKDGKDISNLFNPQSYKQEEFANVYFDTLFNKKATKENFFNIKSKLLKSKPDDQVVVFVSGHGLLNKDLDFYFATYDLDFSNPEIRGISFDDMEHLLDSIPARKKLMMMDACHSGELDKEEPMNMLAQNIETSSDITFRGNVKEYNFNGVSSAESQSGASLNSTFDLMQELFAGLDKGTGAVVISAAAGKGYALESPKWNNGVFTYSILNGLKNKAADKNKDKLITISELKDYSISQVEQLTGGNQKPTARRETIRVDWRIW